MILTPLATLIVPFFGVKPDPALGFLQRRQQQRFEFLIYVPQGSVMSQERFLDLLQPRLHGRVGEQLGAHFHEGPHYPSATLRAGSRAIATARSLLSIIAAMIAPCSVKTEGRYLRCRPRAPLRSQFVILENATLL